MELKDLTISQQDYLAYQQWFQRQSNIRWLRRILLVCGLAAIGIGGWLGITGRWVWGSASAVIFLGVFFIVYLPLLTRVRTARAFRSPKNAAVFSKRSFLIDDTGLTMSASTSTSHSNWSAFLEAAETPRLFILMVAKSQGVLISKATMTDSQIQELRTIIKANMPKALVRVG
ncbi:YcxB family protein [Lacticaseibacillus camelliae]|uniref:YcxB-like C-terminal domain-containing protein n=1 Tax=Lacticaseibacillus camelliae DSM 22697 = JCM 13995 TaxID=1423730 RepID=A0A0R2FAF3_9LACO|nr:YcxB family protein [Lacticaseibacillus camelliae]KRN25337.1 hypothetical protein FC75_GL000699 [Lacticaseibacillus camelliae DSM 22697 = JCM 13995]